MDLVFVALAAMREDVKQYSRTMQKKLLQGFFSALVTDRFLSPSPNWAPYPFCSVEILLLPYTYRNPHWTVFMAWHLYERERNSKRKLKQTKEEAREGREEGEANLWGGCHTDLWDKIVIKQVDDVLLLHLLGRSEFWRWWHGRAFPQLHASEYMATAQTATPKKPETGTRLAKQKNKKNKNKIIKTTNRGFRLREGKNKHTHTRKEGETFTHFQKKALHH